MKTIDIGFSKNKDGAIGSKLIMWYTKSAFSHTYIKLKLSEFEDDSVFHAVGRGVSIASYPSFLSHNVSVAEFSLPISDILFNEICNEFHKRAGEKYGFFQNIGILIAECFGLLKNPIDDGINCSEWVAYCLEEIYPDKWNSSTTDFNLVKPCRIYQFLMENQSHVAT